MKDQVLKMAEAWAHQAYLSTCAAKQGLTDTEDALGWAMFYLWAAEEV